MTASLPHRDRIKKEIMDLFNTKKQDMQIQDIYRSVEKRLNLSFEQLHIPGPSHYRQIEFEIAWCLKDLKLENKLVSPSRGIYRLYKNK